MSDSRKGIDRRAFLRLGAAASGVAVSGCGGGGTEAPEASAGMRYRPLGATGLQVSEVSFGTHGLHNPDLVLAAVDAGITTLCTSSAYRDGHDEIMIGRALSTLGTRRHDLVILTGDEIRPGATADSIAADIDASLRRLGVDRVAIYCTMQVSSPAGLLRDELFEAFDRAHRAGKVAHLALSGHHGGMQSCLEAARADGRFSVFFTRYDFVSYPDQDDLLRRASEQGIGTIVFKVAAGSRQNEIADLEAGGLSFPQATVRWALGNRDVASVCATMTSFDHVRTFAGAVGAPLSRAEGEMLRRYSEAVAHRYCRSCGVCEASCPAGVAIADVNRFAMYFASYGQQKDAMRAYADLPAGRRAAACRSCAGACDGACPFGRPVRSELVAAHHFLSFGEV